MKTKNKIRRRNNRLSVSPILLLSYETLCEIADKGVKWNYNRQLCSKAIRTIPRDRLYPVALTLEHHHRFFKPCETHMRLAIDLPKTLGFADVPMSYFHRLKPSYMVKRGKKIVGAAQAMADGTYRVVVKGRDHSLAGKVKKKVLCCFPEVAFAA